MCVGFLHTQPSVLQGVRVDMTEVLTEDYSGLTAAADREADILVRVSTVALSYDVPPVYNDLLQYEKVECHLQW